MSDYVKFEVKPGADRAPLRHGLVAHFKYERLHRLRGWLVYVPAFASVPLWLEAGWPGLLAHRAVVLSLSLWAVAAAALVGVVIREYTWYRRRTRAGGVEEGDSG